MTRLIAVLLLVVVAAARCSREEAEAPVAAPASRVAPAPPAPEPAAPSAPADVTGAYFPMADLPAEFAEIDFLSLATIDENGMPAPLNGFLRPEEVSAQDFKLVSPELDGATLKFKTISVGGISYEFNGAFLVSGNFVENPPTWETAVLSGTLTKTAGGRVVASTPVSFRYEAGG